MQKLIHMKLKELLPKLAYFSIINLGLVNLVSAQILENPLGETKTFGEVILKLAQVITTVGIPLAGIFIIYSGFLFVTARGSDEQLKKAKTTFLWTIVGTILIVGAWAIANALNEFAKGL
ncbi:MAG: hypothetical protein HYW09_00565 [Candidatus Niyogibacteria bacterium]|nr:hypothetical protein [Candidatus Niyogibacteria bacterium]